ncbi:MAG: dicarboxylate/amino acid:cation symporter [Planctomycetes bacterium]|nr:dicarboxylate/amino acid:cation symporter [Planctomycetota bacterium]
MSSKWLLTLLIMVGLVAGIIVGQMLYDPNFKITMSDAEHAHPTALFTFYFIGDTVFLGLLKMLIIPLIATSVIVGVTSVGDFRDLGKVGIVTLVYYVATMAIAATIGLILVTNIQPGKRISDADVQAGEQTYEAKEDVQENIAQGPSGMLGALQNLVKQIIPKNIIGAAARGQALPVIFFSILLAIMITTLGDKSAILIDFFGALFEAIMKLVQLVIWMTPVGVFSLLTWTVARIGLASFGQAIGGYMITVTLGLAIHGFVVLPLVCVLFARCNPFKFMHQMRQAMMTALGTDSSSATLPVTIECATQNAGISKRSAGFVLPLGSTINMDGTALYEAVAVVFLAQAYGIELGLPQLVLVAITATLAAIGAAGIPSAGLVTMVIVINAVNPGLEAMGKDTIPIAAIGLIIGVDRILDMMRTTVNVWGDAVGAKIVDAIGRR